MGASKILKCVSPKFALASGGLVEQGRDRVWGSLQVGDEIASTTAIPKSRRSLNHLNFTSVESREVLAIYGNICCEEVGGKPQKLTVDRFSAIGEALESDRMKRTLCPTSLPNEPNFL